MSLKRSLFARRGVAAIAVTVATTLGLSACSASDSIGFSSTSIAPIRIAVTAVAMSPPSVVMIAGQLMSRPASDSSSADPPLASMLRSATIGAARNAST